MAAEKPESQSTVPLDSSAQSVVVTTTSSSKIIQKDSTESFTKKDAVIKVVADQKTSENLDVKELNPPPPKKPALETRYSELLKLIAEVGKDIKPAYTNGKGHSDRLRKNISTARNVLRECLGEIDRINRTELQKTDL